MSNLNNTKEIDIGLKHVFCNLPLIMKALIKSRQGLESLESKKIICVYDYLIASSVYSLLTALKEKPVRVVMCNDHSPIPMGFLMYAKAFNLDTFYIQHAPISKYFPPLVFDKVILSDWLSYVIYVGINQTNQMPFPRHVEVLNEDEIVNISGLIAKSNREMKTVGLALGISPKLDEVKELIKWLKVTNGLEVVIKNHPANKENYSNKFRGVKLVDSNNLSANEFLKKVDVLICGNSGIKLEALNNGCPVVYFDKLDDIEFDYFSLVERGLVPLLDLKAKNFCVSIKRFYRSKGFSLAVEEVSSMIGKNK